MASRAQSKGLQLVQRCQASVPFHVTLDQKRLTQVLFNLLSNAVKFTDSGHITLSLTLDERDDQQPQPQPQSPQQRDYSLHFAVSDTGIGTLGAQPAQHTALSAARRLHRLSRLPLCSACTALLRHQSCGAAGSVPSFLSGAQRRCAQPGRDGPGPGHQQAPGGAHAGPHLAAVSRAGRRLHLPLHHPLPGTTTSTGLPTSCHSRPQPRACCCCTATTRWRRRWWRRSACGESARESRARCPSCSPRCGLKAARSGRRCCSTTAR